MKHPIPSRSDHPGQGLWAAALKRWLAGPAPEAEPARPCQQQETENQP